MNVTKDATQGAGLIITDGTRSIVLLPPGRGEKISVGDKR